MGKKVLEFALNLQDKDRRKLGKTAIEYQGNEKSLLVQLMMIVQFCPYCLV